MSTSVHCLTVFAFFVVFAFTGCGKVGTDGFDQQSQEEIMKPFRELNKQCPIEIDEITSLVQVEVLGPTQVVYRYRVETTGLKLSKSMKKRFRAENARKAAINYRKMAFVTNTNIAIDHIYTEKTGRHLVSFTMRGGELFESSDRAGRMSTNPFFDGGSSTKVTPAANSKGKPQQFTNPKTRGKKNPAGVSANPFMDA